MLFQALDNKKECVGVYFNGQLLRDSLPADLSRTWNYSEFLRDTDVDYAELYCNGQPINHVCPEELRGSWLAISSRLKSFLRSFIEARVDLNENCFFDLVPQQFLLEYCDLKNQITQHVFDNYPKPENYEFLKELSKMVYQIRYNKLNIQPEALRGMMAKTKARSFIKNLKNIQPYCDYNIFGTKTGRLTTRKNSFPILTMDKNYRSIIKPTNDWFIELDYNAAELRTLLSLAGQPQPHQDIHMWNVENVYNDLVTREEAKKRIFAWLYNPESRDRLPERTYNRSKILTDYWDGSCVKTPFNRVIDADKRHALNYLIQSSTSDLFLRAALRVMKLLENRKSFLAFTIHDSLVIDLSNEDRNALPEIIKAFRTTELGDFMTNISAGKNFGNMKELKWKQS